MWSCLMLEMKDKDDGFVLMRNLGILARLFLGARLSENIISGVDIELLL
jgi:hypothetical protein